jgi:hypothetical protein
MSFYINVSYLYHSILKDIVMKISVLPEMILLKERKSFKVNVSGFGCRICRTNFILKSRI